MDRVNYLFYQLFLKIKYEKRRYFLYVLSFYVGLLLPTCCIANTRSVEQVIYYTSENNNYEKDLNHIISEILLLMKNSPERCAFLLKAGMDNKRTKYETNDYKSSKLYFQ